MYIDDAIEEGLVEAMKSEADINNAKLVCIFICIERDTNNEVETFPNLIIFGRFKYQETTIRIFVALSRQSTAIYFLPK